MADHLLVPAAQYLRMSTEHQQYSLENQSAKNSQYAEVHGFSIVLTYSDSAKSGLVLRRRYGLKQLLSDVVGGPVPYKAILVYDVSRWGRFQDTDESAHYEFLCKSAGVPVHYCAESFVNDGTMANLIVKALKRVMAGEYSRELGVKVLDGQIRLAQLGFKQGGIPGYGLRRMLVSADRRPKQQLASGERKSIATDRVVLVPGPACEVKCVRDIYRMLMSEKRTIYGIARALNERGIPYITGGKWSHHDVSTILTHPKYTGSQVFNQSSMRLGSTTVARPRSEWVIAPHAHEAIVDLATFDKAQQVLANRTFHKTNHQILESLRSLLASEGRLSIAIMKKSDVVTPSTLRQRFGGVLKAYELIGYDYNGPDCIDSRRRIQALRADLLTRICEMFPHEVSIVRPGGRFRSRLQLRDGVTISVLIGRSARTWGDTRRWRVDPVQRERKMVSMLARLTPRNDAFQDFHIFPGMDRHKTFYIELEDAWLNQAIRLQDLSRFCDLVRKVL